MSLEKKNLQGLLIETASAIAELKIGKSALEKYLEKMSGDMKEDLGWLKTELEEVIPLLQLFVSILGVLIKGVEGGSD